MAWPGVLKAALVLTFVALFLLVVGFVLPWWFVFDQTSTVYMGVFFAIWCPKGITDGNCSVISLAGYTANEINGNADAGAIAANTFFMLMEIVTSTSVGLCFISSLVLIINGCADVRNKCAYIFAAFFLLLSAVTSCSVIAFFVVLYVTVYTVTSLTITGQNFPYSVLFFGLGSLISFVAFILLCVAMCVWRNYDDEDESDDGRGYPMADKRPGYNGYAGYDNPRYMDDRQRSYQPGYDSGSRQYNYAYDSRDRSYGGSKYPEDRNGYPYRQDNMYRPMNNKY